jgi:hypothetical protein
MSNEEREQLKSRANARSMPQGIAARMKIELPAARRVLTAFGVKPHLSRSFHLSAAPFFVEKSLRKYHEARLLSIKHPGFRIRFTPDYSSSLNQSETWFGIITRKVIRRGSLNNVGQFAAEIDGFVEDCNRTL